ncbi:MAG: hypothetical protein ACLQU1_42205 [Bryobacteraceae bacterium]
MKTLTMRSTIAVTALVVAAGSASAQTYKADIPMSFLAGNTPMAAGSYDFQVVTRSGHANILVYKADGSATAMLLPFQGSDAPKAWQKERNPKISFNCLGRTCTLGLLWNGRDVFVYEFPARKLPPAEAERLAVVTVGLTRAD